MAVPVTPDLRTLIARACQIIETGDDRLLASDGPAGGRPPDITLAEWRELYQALEQMRSLLRMEGAPTGRVRVLRSMVRAWLYRGGTLYLVEEGDAQYIMIEREAVELLDG